ncbi:hypothetical protein ERO13_D13G116700v2 [Gossypium hirsutum]|uniref:Nuclear envelope-associated protein 2 isoform X2 n=3 Tax=Gossypium TaxID=3633 RepID=A0A1U8KSX5_GOSHI|nr:nuclear envelope-associated protein 2 isoform X2 [Gossypium hirsutum]KAG4111667.1 hypothetical protein ERO13_D13G116700v2 [Gossypium hirsutum]
MVMVVVYNTSIALLPLPIYLAFSLSFFFLFAWTRFIPSISLLPIFILLLNLIWQHRLLQPKTRTLSLSHLFFFGFFFGPLQVSVHAFTIRSSTHPWIKNVLSLMSVSNQSSLSSSSSSMDFDPLLKDLNEKKQSFRRNVVSLAAELKEEAETKARHMEEEIFKLQTRLEERNGQLQASASAAEKYLRELDDLRSQLSVTQATADASAASAQSAQLQCVTLLKELDEKNSSLKEHEDRVTRLGEQLDNLQKDLQARECSQKLLKDEVLRIEHDIMQAVAKAGANKDCELRKLLDEVSPKNFEKINKLLTVKDEEITKLKDEIRIMSAHWKLKTKELESQLEKQRRADQELKKRVLKLEFCLQEARSQTRKLQRMGERRDKALKELRDQLAAKQQSGGVGAEKQNFWETSGFKIVVSMSMLILVVFSKR